MKKRPLTWLKKIIILPRWVVIFFIFIYQKTISPDHGPFKKFFPLGYCRFYPSCSEYGKQTIKKHGLLIGGAKAVWRIIRCNPWNKGGVDFP
jgi:putative membrane protein insertion efficiency factor